MTLQIFILLAGLLLILFGANWLVDGSSSIAKRFGISEFVIGLTIVGIGTSTPEMVVSFIAAFQGQSELALGNVIGSNIFNILFVLGASSAITAISLDSSMLIDVTFMVFVTVLCFIFGKTQDKFDRKEGAILVALFIAYMIFAILRN